MTTYGYDTENNLTSIQDANQNTTNFSYDAFGRVTQTSFPSSYVETYGYDNVGNLTSKTDRKNQLITYTYDQLNRLTQKSYPDTSMVNYTYDNDSRLTQVIDPTGTYQFAFDNLGRLTGTSTQYAFLTSRTFTTTYGYDAASNRTSFTDPENGSSGYVYDTLNRLQTLTPPTAYGTGSFGLGYDALSRRTSLTRPNTVNTSYGYDTLSRLLSVTHAKSGATLDGATYTVDNAGNRLTRTPQPTGTASTFGYDNIYELLSVTQGGSTTESYTYDPVGNRLTVLGSAAWSYNTSNELNSRPSVSYNYDYNGNTILKTDGTGNTSYTWDYENRMASVILPGSGGTVSFKYDPFGRRIYKSSTSGTSVYAYDGDNLVEETNSSGTAVARYAHGLNIDEPLAMLRSSTTSYYQADGLGSLTSLSNTAGNVAQTYTFDSFGNQTASSGSLVNSFRYTGREFDTETSLYYYRARYYDPTAGKFLGEDPIGFGGGGNFYRYGHNNPVRRRDPLGLWDTYTHGALIWNALEPCGIDHNLIFAMQEESKAWDKATGIDPFFASAHSMARPGQSSADAKREINNFISTQLDAANWAWSNSYDYYYVNFTHAIHAEMDSTSPAHVDSNGDPYVWPSFPNALEHGDEPLSIETWSHMTPDNMRKNIDMIRKAWSRMTGQTLNCGCDK